MIVVGPKQRGKDVRARLFGRTDRWALIGHIGVTLQTQVVDNNRTYMRVSLAPPLSLR